MPCVGCPEHQLLGLGKVRALASLDEITRKRKGGPGETNQRHLEFALEYLDGREHVRERLLGIDDAQSLDLFKRRNRFVDDRALTLRDLKGRSHRLDPREELG